MDTLQTKVGEIVSISGNITTVQLLDSVKSNMPVIDGVVYRIGQVGSFLKVPLGYANLFGIVTQIGAAAIPGKLQTYGGEDYEKLQNRKWLSIVLVGEETIKRIQSQWEISVFPKALMLN